MKTAVVLSDTHRNVQAVEKLLPIMQEADYVFHLGDGAGDLSPYAALLSGKLFRVEGNCDFASVYEREFTMEIEGVRLFACHGHRYGVKQSLSHLAIRAKEQGCTLALYGHTHEGRMDEEQGVTLINPGTLTRFSSHPTYCYLVIHKGKITANLVEIF